MLVHSAHCIQPILHNLASRVLCSVASSYLKSLSFVCPKTNPVRLVCLHKVMPKTLHSTPLCLCVLFLMCIAIPYILCLSKRHIPASRVAQPPMGIFWNRLGLWGRKQTDARDIDMKTWGLGGWLSIREKLGIIALAPFTVIPLKNIVSSCYYFRNQGTAFAPSELIISRLPVA